MKRSIIAAIILSAMLPASALAVEAHHQAAATGAMADAQFAEGEVRKVDKDAKKITIKHGPIPSLDMPAMSMVFQVKNLALLEQVKAGDKIKFSAEKVGGAYIVTNLEPAK